MRYETISRAALSPPLPAGESPVELTVYARPRHGYLADDGCRWGVLILPGGGYGVVSDIEGEPVALSFLAEGMQAFVLRYSVLPDRHPLPLLEAAAAMAYLKDHARDFGIDRIAVCGFSAGGHLAGSLANLWADSLLAETLHRDSADFRPDASILCYPVISMDSVAPGSGTFPNLLGENWRAPEYEKFSLERSVTPQTPPAFLWSTCADRTVEMENTLAYAIALRKAGIPFSLHIYPNGPHAMSVATPESARDENCMNRHAASWLPLCVQWLKEEFV